MLSLALSLELSLAILAIYSIGLVVYRLYFHPLRNFPGPRLAAITVFYQAYFDVILDGVFVPHLEKLHQIYGPVVRISPNELHFSDPNVYSSIYSMGSKFPKSLLFYRGFGQPESSFGNVDMKEAKARRDVLSPLFSRRAILKLEDLVQGKIDFLVNTLLSREQANKPSNLLMGIRSLTLDIISEYCFSSSFDALKAPNFSHPMLISMENATSTFPVFQHLPFLFILRKLPDWILCKIDPKSIGYIKLRKRLEREIDKILEDPSLLESPEHENVYCHLLRLNPVKGVTSLPSRGSLLDEALNMCFAGSDTTGNTIIVGLFHVLHDSKIRERLLNELWQVWPEKDVRVKFETLEKLPYLTAVIKEALRVSLGTTVSLPRVVGTDTTIGAVDVPAGTVVGMSSYIVHMNPSIFPEPSRFIPERWLQQDGSELKSLDPYLVAFSKGTRSCLGINLAWCELYLIFANLLRKIDFVPYQARVEDMRVQYYMLPVFRSHFHAICRRVVE